MTDLFARLQDIVGQRDRWYRQWTQTANPPDWATEGLRLVQSHRDILGMYCEAKAQPVRREGREARLRGLDHASAMGRLTTLGLVVQVLARGYGLEDRGDGDE